VFVVDSQAIDRDATIPDDVIQQLKDSGLFGLQIPLEYGKHRFTLLMIYLFTLLFIYYASRTLYT